MWDDGYLDILRFVQFHHVFERDSRTRRPNGRASGFGALAVSMALV
jgi:hypothetical protein